MPLRFTIRNLLPATPLLQRIFPHDSFGGSAMHFMCSHRPYLFVVACTLIVSASVRGQEAVPDTTAADGHNQPDRVLVVRVHAYDQGFTDAQGYVKLVNVETKKILGILDDNTKLAPDDKPLEGQAVLANDDNSNKARQWRIEKDEDGVLKIINRKSGQVLDLCKSSNEEGGEIIQWPEWQPKFPNQRFEWVGDGNERRLMNQSSGLVLDVDEGGKIVQAKSNANHKKQLWRVVKVTD
jgi:hypothetical protein